VPELPEVETLRRALDAALPGRTITDVDIRLPKIFRPAPGIGAADLVGARFARVWRRAKYLICDLSNDLSLVIHLRLSGQLVLRRGDEILASGGHPVPAYDAPLPHKSTHLSFGLDDGSRLWFTDIRQFGFCLVLPTGEVAAYLAGQRLGPEALGDGFTLAGFIELLRRRRTANLKSLLLDQSAIAGLGNIYADESLWLAGLHPLRAAASLSEAEAARLYQAIRDTLDYALTNGVAEMKGDRAQNPTGFPHVHGREGQPCPRCKGIIERVRVGGRSTYFCAGCQR
jgi:formamidopyrimidine-DNA glycosylase